MKQDSADELAQAEYSTGNRCASTYLASAAKLATHAVEFLIESSHVKSGDRVLDVACGPGHISRKLAATFAKVTGIDMAPNMIKFHEANVDDLLFDWQTFDAVLVNYLTHHFERPDQAVRDQIVVGISTK